jgi:hypothetical protein
MISTKKLRYVRLLRKTSVGRMAWFEVEVGGVTFKVKKRISDLPAHAQHLLP